MVDLECPSRLWSARLICMVAASVTGSLAQPIAVAARWHVNFPAAANGQAGESTAVPVSADSIMVVVVSAGADAMSPKLQVGSRSIPLKVIGYDPVSRLEFIKIEGDMTPKPMGWVEDAGANSNAALQSMEPSGPVKCRSTGWVKQVGGKILPLALLRVNFSRAVPAPGTPLVDEAGRVVAIVFQNAGSDNIGYAIPAEAVRRVQQDICDSGQLTRGWLGLTLSAESKMPRVIRVLPDSPAAAAGIRPNDVLLSIGSRQVMDYPDAANAFFYLIPDRQVQVKLLRDVEQLEYTVTPVKPKG